MYSKIILLSLCVLLFSSTQCHSKGENQLNETDDSMVLETISIDKETNTNSYLLTTSKSQEEIEELLSKEHLIILNHKHKNKKTKKESKKAKKEAKKTEKNGVPPSPNNKPPEEVPVIVPSSASEPNVTTPSVIESTNETNPSIEQSTSEEVFNNTEIIEPISHVVREVTDNDIETSSEETDERRGERSRRGEEDDDYYEPIDEFAVIKVEKVNRAFLSKIKFHSKEIEMKDEPFSYAYSLVVFLVVLALVILGLQLLFGNSKKQGDYLLIDENPNINEFSLQYSK